MDQIVTLLASSQFGSILLCLRFTFLSRRCLWILGNEQTLLNSNSIWEALVLDAKDRQCFFHADEDPDMRKTILDVKKELDQLDDLLNKDSILFKEQKWKVHTFINFSCFCYIYI